jgi:cytochrome P450
MTIHATTRPPGPPGSAAGWANLRAFQRSPLEFFDRLRPFGDIAWVRLGPVQTYFVNNPALIRELLAERARQVRKVRRTLRVFEQVDGQGLLVSQGDFWRRQRRLIQPAFAHARLGRYADDVVRAARGMTATWRPGETLDVVPAMTHLTLRIIARVLFNVDVADEAARLGDAVHVLSEALMRDFYRPFILPSWLPLPENRRKRRALAVLDDFILGLIRERRRTREDAGDLLSMLLLAADAEEGNRGMTDRQVRDEAVTLFNAGHDTTAASLAWIWACVAHHPAVEARLIEESARVLGGRPATIRDLPELTYTNGVVRETLRLFPPTMGLLPREATEPIDLAGYRVPRGAWLYMSPWLTQRDDRFFPDALQFDPERFAPGRAASIPPNAWFPFGHGPHVCIGRDLALMESTLVVATVLQRYRLTRPGSAPFPEAEPLVSLRPRGGLPLGVDAL